MLDKIEDERLLYYEVERERLGEGVSVLLSKISNWSESRYEDVLMKEEGINYEYRVKAIYGGGDGGEDLREVARNEVGVRIGRVEQEVSSSEGGEVIFEGTSIEIPSGSLGEDTEITIEMVEGESSGMGGGVLSFASEVYEYGPVGVDFAVDNSPLLRVSYDGDRLGGISESELKMYTRSEQELSGKK